jgi:hypothetical protein
VWQPVGGVVAKEEIPSGFPILNWKFYCEDVMTAEEYTNKVERYKQKNAQVRMEVTVMGDAHKLQIFMQWCVSLIGWRNWVASSTTSLDGTTGDPKGASHPIG